MAKTALSGTRIRMMRTARQIGQADLARQAGVSPSYLNLIEHNRRRASPRLLRALAEALRVAPEALDEATGDAQIATLREAVAQARPGTEPETDRVEEFVGRFPGWAALLVDLFEKTQEQGGTIERLADRMAHDPNISAALHEIVSAVTGVQSTAAILVETDDLDPNWRTLFHGNVHADSVRLANAAEALVAYLDTSTEDAALAAPQEELEGWLEGQDFHVAVLEQPEPPDWALLVDGQTELASEAARALAIDWLSRAWADAQALPLDRLVPALSAMFAQGQGFRPDHIAESLGTTLPRLFRRLATLPKLARLPRFGLVICDGSGTLVFRRPVDGFNAPRFGGACPLWPLYQALAQPGRPVAQMVEFAGLPTTRFVAHAICTGDGAPRFDAPPVWQSLMLLTAAAAAMPASLSAPRDVLGVGSSCRVCPRQACAARREPSIVSE